MQSPPRYRFMRRILFPYSGEEPLTRKQGLRVILAWALLFPLTMSVGAVALAVPLSIPLSTITQLVLFTLLSGLFIFGSLGILIVSMSNRAAQFRQARKAPGTNNTRGGRYGS